MSKYTVRYRLAGEYAFHLITVEAISMKDAIDAGYSAAKGLHGQSIMDFRVAPSA